MELLVAVGSFGDCCGCDGDERGCVQNLAGTVVNFVDCDAGGDDRLRFVLEADGSDARK